MRWNTRSPCASNLRCIRSAARTCSAELCVATADASRGLARPSMPVTQHIAGQRLCTDAFALDAMRAKVIALAENACDLPSSS